MHNLKLIFYLTIFLFFNPFLLANNSTIIAIGGGNSQYIDDDILKLVKHHKQPLCILPIASNNISKTKQRFISRFKNKLNIRFIDSKLLNSENLIKHCSALYISGGKQKRLFKKLKLNSKSYAKQNILSAYYNGVPIIGNSAGLAVLSDPMIINNKSINTGIGLVPFALDQHFLERNRLSRLISLMNSNMNTIGIGVDNMTALIFKSEKYLLIKGYSAVVILERIMNSKKKFYMSLLWNGDMYKLDESVVIPNINSSKLINKKYVKRLLLKNKLLKAVKKLKNKENTSIDFTLNKSKQNEKKFSIQKCSNTTIYNNKKNSTISKACLTVW